MWFACLWTFASRRGIKFPILPFLPTDPSLHFLHTYQMIQTQSQSANLTFNSSGACTAATVNGVTATLTNGVYTAPLTAGLEGSANFTLPAGFLWGITAVGSPVAVTAEVGYNFAGYPTDVRINGNRARWDPNYPTGGVAPGAWHAATMDPYGISYVIYVPIIAWQ